MTNHHGEEDAVSDDENAIDSESITASVENDPDTPRARRPTRVIRHQQITKA
ncbi:MAG: hypothetical protein CM15mP48_0040 [Candidatus Poseidoniales archaeon]|nr:MAG: hypothetical protein CM15mP48_0040 [Candidatus Poseidoniales archaeon]